MTDGGPILIGQPRQGFYRTRLCNGGIWVGVMIWHGRPVVDGRQQDRAPRWCIAVDQRTTDDAGDLLDIHERWPWVAGEPISHKEYAFLLRRARWARRHQPDHPAANPYRPIDRRKLPPLIGGE